MSNAADNDQEPMKLEKLIDVATRHEDHGGLTGPDVISPNAFKLSDVVFAGVAKSQSSVEYGLSTA